MVRTELSYLSSKTKDQRHAAEPLNFGPSLATLPGELNDPVIEADVGFSFEAMPPLMDPRDVA
jgi:hypothetical protein